MTPNSYCLASSACRACKALQPIVREVGRRRTETYLKNVALEDEARGLRLQLGSGHSPWRGAPPSGFGLPGRTPDDRPRSERAAEGRGNQGVAFQGRALLRNLEWARPCKGLLLGCYQRVSHGDRRRRDSF